MENTWDRGMNAFLEVFQRTDRNKMAALLSVVPGAGHLYKRHIGTGLTILAAGNALMAFATAWLSMATLGLALVLIPPAWWVGVAVSAYYAEDRHPHHPAPQPRMGAARKR